jgi:bacteriorhodopsin
MDPKICENYMSNESNISNEPKKKNRTKHRASPHDTKVQPVLQPVKQQQQQEPESPASESNDELSIVSQDNFEHNVIFQQSVPAVSQVVDAKRKRKQGNSPKRMNSLQPETRKNTELSPQTYTQPSREMYPPEQQLSIDLSDPNFMRDSLNSNPQIQNLIRLLKEEGMVTETPKRSANDILQSAHQSIKKRREVIQALETPCLDHYCEQLCWTTQYIFSISTIVLLIFYGSFDHPAPFVNTFLVQAIASIAYFVKASHVGEMKIGDTPVPFVRYVDWITTTPLMLYELCHIAHAEGHVIVMVIGCDLITLSLGISSAVIDQEHHFGVKYTLFVIAAAFYILMVSTLVMDVAQPLYDSLEYDDDHYVATDDHTDSNIEHTIELFDNLETLMIVSWSFYPIAVLLGRAHFGVITQSVEDGFICVLDIISKIGMEGMIIAYAVQHYQGSSDDGGH